NYLVRYIFGIAVLSIEAKRSLCGASPDYESGGQEFESLRARQHLAPTFRAKNTAILRNLQGTELAPILRLMRSCIGQWLAPLVRWKQVSSVVPRRATMAGYLRL